MLRRMVIDKSGSTPYIIAKSLVVSHKLELNNWYDINTVNLVSTDLKRSF